MWGCCSNHTNRLILALVAPNEYSIPTVLGSSKEGKIKSAPAFTIVGRHKKAQPKAVIPGPGAYDGRYEVIVRKAPHYSMGDRVGRDEKSLGPGPAAHLPEKVFRLTAFRFTNCYSS